MCANFSGVSPFHPLPSLFLRVVRHVMHHELADTHGRASLMPQYVSDGANADNAAALPAQETKQVFEKLFKYIGKSIKALIDRTDEPHCLRLHKNRVFYVRESLMRRATNVRDAFGFRPSLGT